MQTSCDVLRCQEPGSVYRLLAAPEWDQRAEMLVCTGHDNDLAQGADWRWIRTEDDADRPRLLMGREDLGADGSLLMTGSPSLTDSLDTQMSSRPGHRCIVSFEASRSGHDEVDEVRLVLTTEQAGQLAALMKLAAQHLPPSAE